MGLLQNVVGSLKDTASITKTTLLSSPTAAAGKSLSLRLAVLRATSHTPSLPSARHLTSLLSLSNSLPRATASAAVDSLISRLSGTRSAAVAIKCLILLHGIVHRGGFILHDQISFFLSASSGRRNRLNLAAFRDGSSLSAWEISTWIRWYARYLEQILTISRFLGLFLFSISCNDLEREKATESIASLSNGDLLRQIGYLIDVLEEICRCPADVNPTGDGNCKLVNEVIRLVAEDYRVVVSDLASRIAEFRHRLSCLSFGDSVEFVCSLRRVESCREKLSEMFPMTAKAPAAVLFEVARWLREELVAVSESVEERAAVSRRRVGRIGESARLEERVLIPKSELVRFSSNRYVS